MEIGSLRIVKAKKIIFIYIIFKLSFFDGKTFKLPKCMPSISTRSVQFFFDTSSILTFLSRVESLLLISYIFF